jgi:tricarballylate dehydrogenase
VETSSSASELDVVVVGAGSAGLAAAVAAALSGARVAVLEKAGVAGGNARFSHTGFRAAYSGPEAIRPFVGGVEELELPGYPVAEYAAELASYGVPAALAGVLARGSGPALRWMRQLGIPFLLNRSVEAGGRRVFEPGLVLAADGLVEQWLRLAARLGVELRYGCAVEEVLPGRGVVAGGELIAARGIVIASGGFQASAQRRARHLGSAAGVVRGAREDTGEVLEALLASGAAPAGAWDEAVISPVDAASPPVEGGNRMNRYSYPFGITVDRNGRRFFDEGAGGLASTYATVGKAILTRPGGVAYQLFDADGERLVKTYAYRFARVLRAGSVRGLARVCGIDPDALEQTVTEFNDACPSGVAFDPGRPDGRATRGVQPPKSNWARPLVQPPFSAYPVTGGITFTLGGVAIDEHARVLDREGDALPGVFATGDALGLFRGGYPSGAGQTRNVVFGRLAASALRVR